MIYCKTCGALIMDDDSKCTWCKSDPNRESKVQRQTIVRLVVAIIVAVITVVGFLGVTAAMDSIVAERDISNDMSYEELVDVVVQALYVTSDADTFCDAIHPKQFESYVRAANISEKEFKARFREFLLDANREVVSAQATIVADNYDLTGTALDEYTSNFNFYYGANVDAVKGVEVQVTITKENGETVTETANMVFVHQNNCWYIDADKII